MTPFRTWLLRLLRILPKPSKYNDLRPVEVKREPKTPQQANLADVERRFAEDITEHEMHVLKDDEVYRHLVFKRPGTSMYYFGVTTFPGHLVFSGDMGDFTFSRHGTSDMLEMFRGGRGINPSYWGEKVVAGEIKTFSVDVYKQSVKEFFENYTDDWFEEVYDDEGEFTGEVPTADRLGLWEAITSELLEGWRLPYSEHEAYAMVDAFEYTTTDGKTWRFQDFYEYPLKDYIYQFLWACHAIRWGVQQYDNEAKEAVA